MIDLETRMQVTTLLISFMLGIASGFIMYRSDFCIAGMFRDLFLFRVSPLFPSLVLLVSASMLMFELAQLTGLISGQQVVSLYGPPSLTNLFGGMLFGVGMVLAGGCVVGTLYKLGAGHAPAMFSFVGLIVGSTLYAEFHQGWMQLAAATRLTSAHTLSQLIDLPSALTSCLVMAVLFFLVIRWQVSGVLLRPNVVRNYLQPRTTALFLAVIGLLSFALTGMPLGITTSYAKVGSFIGDLIFPEHFTSLAYFQGQGFSYLSPLSGQFLSAGAGPFWDGLSLVQFPLIGGIVIGAGFSAFLAGKFRICFDMPKLQMISAFYGGIMMGLASRMTPGCNVWHLLGGLPLFSLQSILFTLGLVPGAWLGTRILLRFVLRN